MIKEISEYGFKYLVQTAKGGPLPGVFSEEITQKVELLMLNVVVFLMGFFLSPGAIILIAVPIILPVAKMKRKE
jgi:TRAP-type C4-dicarboxylate transport system permease large subunit